MILGMDRLHGLSYERASLYGLPHIGARYSHGAKWKRNGARRYERTQSWCCVCGRPADNCHHVVPISFGEVFEMDTHNGTWALRSPLFCLCGSGTCGCHGEFHQGILRATWEWDEEEYERMWWDGELLRRYAPNHPGLYLYGQWVIRNARTGEEIVHREMV